MSGGGSLAPRFDHRNSAPRYDWKRPSIFFGSPRQMPTRVARIDPLSPNREVLREAAEILRHRGLVAFPTETVYGLGALALDPVAVARIYEAKGRPAANPIIVHAHNVAAARALVAVWPPLADRLAERYWPGPLTLVLPKSDAVPPVVTAGGPTVAIRVPKHSVALALLGAVGAPLAAPSANVSEGVSATRAEHVLKSLDGRIELILDGDPTPGGLESTVLDLSVSPPRILRPGLVDAGELGAFLGEVESATESQKTSAVLRSPGMLKRHYAPRAKLLLADDESAAAMIASHWADEGLRVGWIAMGSAAAGPRMNVERIILPADAKGYAAALYHALHELDARGVDRIVVARPPSGAAWQAIHDRLSRAAAE